MENLAYKIELRRQKLQLKTYAILCLVLLLSVGLYSYKKWGEYKLVSEGMVKNREFSETLRNEVANEKSTYDGTKVEFDTLNKEIEQNLKTVFPASDNYTILTRQIDSYEQELSTKNNPFEVSHIDYQPVIEAEKYRILPFTMDIRSSRENFVKFLHLVETSGSLNSEVRLMDISSIRLNFENSEERLGTEIITFLVQINAYFQK